MIVGRARRSHESMAVRRGLSRGLGECIVRVGLDPKGIVFDACDNREYISL